MAWLEVTQGAPCTKIWPQNRRTTHRAPKSSPKNGAPHTCTKIGLKIGAPHTAHQNRVQKTAHRTPKSTPKSAHHTPRTKIEPKKRRTAAPKSTPESAYHTSRTKTDPKNGAPHTKNEPEKAHLAPKATRKGHHAPGPRAPYSTGLRLNSPPGPLQTLGSLPEATISCFQPEKSDLCSGRFRDIFIPSFGKATVDCQCRNTPLYVLLNLRPPCPTSSLSFPLPSSLAFVFPRPSRSN